MRWWRSHFRLSSIYSGQKQQKSDPYICSPTYQHRTLSQSDDLYSICFYILTIFNSPSIIFSDLTSTVASYFDMNMGSVEFKLKRAVESIRHGFFDVANLKGIRFLDFSKKNCIHIQSRYTPGENYIIYI